MTMDIRQLDTIRLREAIHTEDNLGGGEARTLPVGATGTVLAVFPGGALEAEFMLTEPQFDGGQLVSPGTWHTATLEPHQVEPA